MKKIKLAVYIGILIFSLVGVHVFSRVAYAQQIGISKPPSVNCPVSLYDHARLIKKSAPEFSSLQDFSNFFSYYKRFANTYDSSSGNSFYTINFGIPNQTGGFRIEFYEQAYSIPLFTVEDIKPKAVYPNQTALVPFGFILSSNELTILNSIYLKNPPLANKLIQNIWLLKYYETQCGSNIDDLNTIPENPAAQGVTGYGKTRVTSQSFTLDIPPDLWTNTTQNSITLTGTIHAIKEVSPTLKVAYGTDPKNLNFLAPNNGNYFFSSPLARNDSVTIQPLVISVEHLKIPTKTPIYFSVVDGKNPSLAYTDVLSLEVGNPLGTVYTIEQDKAKALVDTQSNSGVSSIISNICDGPDCDFNDLINLFLSFWKFILIIVIPIIAIMTAWIGYNFMQHGAEYREKAKEMTSNMIIGLLLVFFAWFIVNTILNFTVGKDSCYSFLGKGNVDPKCLENKK